MRNAYLTTLGVFAAMGAPHRAVQLDDYAVADWMRG